MLEVVIATTNPGKARELAQIFADANFRCADLSSLDQTPPHVQETGATFRVNACLKASAYAKHYNRWALADDSGLEVDALNGAPGIHSARWAERHDAGKGDRDNNRLLLRQLDAANDRRRAARFVCVLALSDPQGRMVLTARGQVSGRILREARGSNGFGYDPLFLIAELGQTTAELPPTQKHAFSHRGRAAAAMKDLIASRLNAPRAERTEPGGNTEMGKNSARLPHV